MDVLRSSKYFDGLKCKWTVLCLLLGAFDAHGWIVVGVSQEVVAPDGAGNKY